MIHTATGEVVFGPACYLAIALEYERKLRECKSLEECEYSWRWCSE